jgi:hypothetical protein
MIFNLTESAISGNNNYNGKEKPDCERNLKLKMTVFWVMRCVILQKLTDVPKVLTASMCHRPDDGSSKLLSKSVSFYETTRRSMPEDNHTCSLKDLKSQGLKIFVYERVTVRFDCSLLCS